MGNAVFPFLFMKKYKLFKEPGSLIQILQ